jgi:hypothetical protein
MSLDALLPSGYLKKNKIQGSRLIVALKRLLQRSRLGIPESQFLVA